VLIDTGIGLADCHAPDQRLGRELIELAGFRFVESMTALRQLEGLGLQAAQVSDIVLTHADPDHVGGLADFPHARIHISVEELNALNVGAPRYCPQQFAHGPKFKTYSKGNETWQGIAARPVDLPNGITVRLLELFGHTLGHCGVIIELPGESWVLHVGDAYYLRAELDDPNHPVCTLAEARAEDNSMRLASLQTIRGIRAELGDKLTITGYHDLSEFEMLANC